MSETVLLWLQGASSVLWPPLWNYWLKLVRMP